VWSESSEIADRVGALAHDARSAELLDRLVRGEKALKLGIKRSHQFRLERLAARLRETAGELEEASRIRR
jgi:hypothetical protein